MTSASHGCGRDCLFCIPPHSRFLREGTRALALTDGFPVTDDLAVVGPRRHVGSLFDPEGEELQAIWAMVAQLRLDLAGSPFPLKS